MIQWEYKIINFGINLSALLKIARWDLEIEGTKFKTEDEVVGYMNQMGNEGWEVCASSNGTDHSGNVTKIVCIFKRPKPPAQEVPAADPQA